MRYEIARPRMFAPVSLKVFPHLSVAPDTINNHVKTCREEKKSLHFFAPEYGGKITFILFVFSAAFAPIVTSFIFLQLLPTLPQPWIFIPLECAP